MYLTSIRNQYSVHPWSFGGIQGRVIFQSYHHLSILENIIRQSMIWFVNAAVPEYTSWGVRVWILVEIIAIEIVIEAITVRR